MKAAATLRAGIEPLAHVPTLMFEQGRGVFTGLATVPTSESWELNTVWVKMVSVLVTLEVQGAVEALATVWADMRLAPCMGALVPVQVRGASKSLATVPTGVRPLAGVNAPMSLPV